MGSSDEVDAGSRVGTRVWATRRGRCGHTLLAMTTTTNAQELGRLRNARQAAAEKFARQTKLLEQLESTAGELATVTDKWNGQLAALATLAGSTAAAADLSGLAKSDIDSAVKASDKAAVDAALEAAKPRTRRRHAPTTTATPTQAAAQADSAGKP
jgi:hypothetical protein